MSYSIFMFLNFLDNSIRKLFHSTDCCKEETSQDEESLNAKKLEINNIA